MLTLFYIILGACTLYNFFGVGTIVLTFVWVRFLKYQDETSRLNSAYFRMIILLNKKVKQSRDSHVNEEDIEYLGH